MPKKTMPACSKCGVHAAERGNLCPACAKGVRRPEIAPLDAYAAFVDLVRPVPGTP